jgi:hypothetical protein
MMDSVAVNFALDSGGLSEVREFGEEALNRCVTIDGLCAGNQ